MKYVIIDGYNLLHKIPRLKNLMKENPDSAQMNLLYTARRSLNSGEKLVLVLDGYSNFKSSDIIYSGNVTADEVIRKRLLTKKPLVSDQLADIYSQEQYSINNKINFSDAIKRQKFDNAQEFFQQKPEKL